MISVILVPLKYSIFVKHGESTDARQRHLQMRSQSTSLTCVRVQPDLIHAKRRKQQAIIIF